MGLVIGVGPSVKGGVKRNEFGNTGTVDAAGLAALGWHKNDIDWLQSVCWWDAEDNDLWRVTDANKAFGPNGATPISWANYNNYKNDVNLRYFPKLAAPSTYHVIFDNFPYVYAIPTDGWATKLDRLNGFGQCLSLMSVGDFAKIIEGCNFYGSDYNMFILCPIRTIGNITQAFTISGYLRGTFSNCWNLRNFEGWHLNTAAVTPASCLADCRSLVTMDIPSCNNDISLSNAFALTNIKHSGKLSGNVNLSASMLLTRASCLVLFAALDAEASGKTITLHANAKARLSDADKQIVTDKGWTLA